MVSLTRPHRLSSLPAPPPLVCSTRSSCSGASTEVSSSAGGSQRGAQRRVNGGVNAETAGLGVVGGASIRVGVRQTKGWRPQLEARKKGSRACR